MNVRILTAGVGAALLVPLALPSALAQPARLVPAARLALQADTVAEFMTEFRQALKIRATDEIAKLMRRRESDAVVAIALTCQNIGEGSSEKLELEMAGLRRAWKEAFKTRFPTNYYEYHSLMRSPVRSQRGLVMTSYTKKRNAFARAFEEQETADMPQYALEFEQIAAALEEVGDLYFASESWRLAAIATDEHTVGAKADLESTLRNYEKAFQARKRIDLLDARYNEAFERHKTLKLQGFGGGVQATSAGGGSGDEIPADDAPAAAPGEPITVAMSFDPLKSIDEVKRPIYGADANFPTWYWLQFAAEGDAQPFGGVDGAIQVVRTGVSAAMADQDRDGEGDVKIPISGNIERVDVNIAGDGEPRPWAFFAAVGSDQTQNYQGFVVNLAPTVDFLSLYIAGAGAVTGELAGTQVRVFDDNMDSSYGTPPVTWNLVGLREGNTQTDLDSMLIGSSKRAVPWSEYQKVGDTWYRFETRKNGMELVATPTEVQTGFVKLDFKGGKPDFVVIKGVADRWANCYYDLAAGGSKGLEVPLGRYELVSGRLSKGKGEQMIKALIVPGDDPPEVVVGPNKPSSLALGAPFKFDFKIADGPEAVKVIGQSVAVTGRGGEMYDRMWNVLLQPEAALRPKGAKRGGKAKKMRIITDQQQPEMAQGWQFAWRPLDIELSRNKLNSDEVPEVQLTLKKNKLFGSKLVSDWKE